MFDFPVKESTIGTSLYCLLFYIAIVLANYRYALKYPFRYSINNGKISWTLFLIGFFFITHCLQGDFFHLMEHVYDFSEGAYNFGEEVYSIIGLFFNNNYFLFRTVVWGGAFLLFCLTAKRMEVPVYYAAVLLLATHSIIFAYARVTAAMAIYFFGLSFLCQPLNIRLFRYTISYILGIAIILCSTFFHNSAVLMVIMTLMLFIPLRKWSIILILILLPTFAVIFKDILEIIALAENTDAVIAKKIETYSAREVEHGISGILLSFLEYASFYIPFVLTLICIIFKSKLSYIPTNILNMYKVALGLVLVSILFFFMGSTFVTFVYRILFMAMIPLTIVIVKLYQCGFMKRKYYVLCVWSGISYIFAKYLYTLYCHL